MKSVLAIDIGATSGRAILSYVDGEKLIFEEINKFPNIPIKERGHLCWNVDFLFSKILESIEIAKSKSNLLSVGIDTWGVDFALIDRAGKLISLPVHYRDNRTSGILDYVSEVSSISDLYFKTGNQLMEINTLFQLICAKATSPDSYFQTDKILMIPDYFNYLLTGKKVIERSIASTTQMVNPFTKDWNREILSLFDISDLLLPPIVQEGNVLGTIKPEFGLGKINIINVCEHDTASAVVSIPFQEEHCLFISSGTWSLIGIEMEHPIINEDSLKYNFTNEAGYNGTTTFLKNCTGLWIIEELRRDFKLKHQSFTFEDITNMVNELQTDVAIIDTEYPEFSKPDNMIEKIKLYAKKSGQKVPETPAELFKCAYLSLAMKYKEVILQLEDMTNYQYKTVNFIGGGSKSEYFSQLVADITGKTVVTGLTEATSIGNALIQLVTVGEISNIQEGKELVAKSVLLKKFTPKTYKGE